MRRAVRAAGGAPPTSARRAAVALVSSALVALLLAPAASGQDAALEDPLAVRLSEELLGLGTQATPIGPFESVRIASDGAAFREIGVEPARCYTLMAIAESADADLDLHLYADGVAVASDVATDNQPRIFWCNPGFERVSLELRMYRGEGRIVWIGLEAPDPSAADPLQAALWAAAGRFAQGYRPASEPIRSTLATGQSASRAVLLASQRCFAVVSAAAPTVVDLDLRLLDPAGEVVDFDEGNGAQPVLRYCTEDAGGEYVVESALVDGFGDVLWQIYSD